MCTLSYTIKASAHPSFEFNSLMFNSLTGAQTFASVYILAQLSNKLSKVKIALCSELYKINH